MLKDLQDTGSFSKETTPPMKVTKLTGLHKFANKDNGCFQAVVSDKSDARLLTVYTTDEALRRNYQEGRIIVLTNYKVYISFVISYHLYKEYSHFLIIYRYISFTQWT